jgi:RNA polymerase sigma-70 factor (ECF subfamily)
MAERIHSEKSTQLSPGSGSFPTTDWGMFTRFYATDPALALASLDRLCAKYWYPVYAYIRRSGNGWHDSEDLTQAFFAHILNGDGLRHLDQGKGRFRSFLLTCAVNFLSNDRSRKCALKRGGGQRDLSRDSVNPEERYRLEPVDHLTPDLLFERRWALVTIEAAMDRLGREYETSGRAAVFEALKPLLIHVESGAIAGTACALGMNESATRVALHRMRRRLGLLLRNQIALTVESPDEIEDELRHLLGLLG